MAAKRRNILAYVTEKYRKKVVSLEDGIKKILDEEWEEKALARAEAQTNKIDKMLKGEADEKENRGWFQDRKQRKEEKERLKLTPASGEDGKPKKKGRAQRRKKKGDGGAAANAAEERARREVEKVALYQARLAKRSSKPKRIKAVVETNVNAGAGRKTKRKKSSFEKDLTDVSRKGVKGLRYDEQGEERPEIREQPEAVERRREEGRRQEEQQKSSMMRLVKGGRKL
ncbi:hypothetical protein AAG570_007215 [Ranatra chinensis]|uniref:Uncharacterized protein n=1 Tax=Ranatra chinensis TaxID=642074 RepID=A0ABD0YH18_9HEMI